MATCKGCHAEIIWGETIGYKRIPLDPAVVTIATVIGGKYKIVRGHVPHHITCPNADQFRKGK